MNPFETLIHSCDAFIRGGKPREAARLLSQIKPIRVPREWRLPLAKICRRTGQYSMGLRLLDRLVNEKPMWPEASATAAETTEYAALLLRSGAVNEALRTLSHVDAHAAPEAYLISAFTHFARWEFAEAIPSLESYLECELSPDAALVGRSNLAFARSECGQFEQASLLTDQNIELAKERGHFHLENYNHALRGQIHIEEGNFVLARAAVDLALRDVDSGSNSTHFFAHKLKLIVDGLESKSLAPFAELRKLSEAHRQWNALREADLYSLRVCFEEPRFLHLYFGSPLPGFRERIWRELRRRPDQETYILGPESAPCFDLASGEIDGQDGLRANFTCHRLIEVLLRDFYQPKQIAGLHAALFPEEHFNISSSPDRVHQIIRRTRRWLEEKQIPVIVFCEHEFYSLKICGSFSFRVSREHGPVDSHLLQVQRLRNALADRPIFSAAHIRRELGISTTSVHRFLRKAIEAGDLERIGPSKHPAGYRFTSHLKTKAS
jgi:tetratricopeptide (TPR) repeat protein